MVRVGKKSGPVLSRLWTKVHEIFAQCRRPFLFSSAIAGLSVSCFVQKIFAIKYRSLQSRTNVKVYWSPLFSGVGDNPNTVLQQIVSATYHSPFAKVWLSSVCWSPSAEPAGQWRRKQNLHRVSKMAVQFEAVYGPKFMTFWDDVGNPL